MKKIIFTLLTVVVISHAGVLTWLEAEEANNHALQARKTAQENQKSITTLKENNRKIDEAKQLLENKKTKLTVKAEIEDGFMVKETEIEFTVDSLGDSGIDLASRAISDILTKED